MRPSRYGLKATLLKTQNALVGRAEDGVLDQSSAPPLLRWRAWADQPTCAGVQLPPGLERRALLQDLPYLEF